MTSNQATVECLTAEVRVLMVGSRQVTLSVYRQLDRVPLSECDPFGRVRDGKDLTGTWIVGRHRETGELVAAVSRPPSSLSTVDTEELSLPDGWLTTRRRLTAYDREPIRVDGVGFTLNDFDVVVEPDGQTQLGGPLEPRFTSPELELEVRSCVAELKEEFSAEVARHGSMKALPLIVLAGLR